MHTWTDVAHAAPDLARAVRARFEAHGLGLLATLRRDGSPRISGVEPLFALDDLWLGMMPGSRKASDLVRDPRFALHSATADKQATAGDAKIAGRALAVVGEAELARYAEAFEAVNGYPPGAGPFTLFRADVMDISVLRVVGDHLEITFWRVGSGVQTIERR